MRRAIVRSRSARKEGLVGARGARWGVANSRAVEVEGLFAEEPVEGLAVAERMSSMRCRRSRVKGREVYESRGWIKGGRVAGMVCGRACCRLVSVMWLAH